jgi:PAS domain S-box-containing protein
MDKSLRILLLEDSIDDADLIESFLKREKVTFSLKIVETRTDYEMALEQFCPEVVISDHNLPQFNSMEALKLYNEYKEKHRLSSAFILVTGSVSEEFAVEIMKKGADDYILKDRLKRLPVAIYGALEKNAWEAQRRKIEEEKLHLLDILQRSLHEIYIFHPETLLYEYANEEAHKNTGYTPEEIQALSPLDLMSDFDISAFKEMLLGVEKSQKGQVYEAFHVRKDESKYPVQVHFQLVVQGHRKTFLANVLDMTETKKQQQQNELAQFIQKTFNESRTLKESFSIILKKVCSQNDCIPAAEIWANHYGNSQMKRFAHYDVELKPPSKAGVLLSEMALKNGEAVTRNLHDILADDPELQIREKELLSAMACPIMLDQKILAVIVVYSTEQANDQNPIYNFGENVRGQLANNIKRKKTEDELSQIFELSPDALVIVGQDGYFKKVNPTFGKMLGFSIQEILSKVIGDFVHPDDTHTIENWERGLKEGKDQITYCENRYKTHRGDYVWLAWSIIPFLEDGMSFAVGKNITEQKKQLETIKYQNERLAEITWEQSHLVRAPLSRIMGCIPSIEGSGKNKNLLLKSIESSAYELDDIIRQIVKKAELVKGINENR